MESPLFTYEVTHKIEQLCRGPIFNSSTYAYGRRTYQALYVFYAQINVSHSWCPETKFLNKMMRLRRNTRGYNLAPSVFHVRQLHYNSTCLTLNLPLSLQCHICGQKSICTQKNSCPQKRQKNLHRSNRCQQLWDSYWVDLPNASNGVLMKHTQIRQFLAIEPGTRIVLQHVWRNKQTWACDR